MSNLIVSKFGGCALANSEMVKKTINLINANSNRKYIVVSSPGKRSKNDVRVTDLLYVCYLKYTKKENFTDALNEFKARYSEIISGLGISFDLDSEIDSIKQKLFTGKSKDFIASRGEYLMAKILAKALNREFIDATELIFFNRDESLDEERTYEAASKRLAGVESAVIPGFYGNIAGTEIHTFPRGGSDVSGALIARAVNADICEKWSETTEIFSADPAIVKDPLIVRNVTYDELRELTCMGIRVIFEDVILLLQKVGIPLLIRNIYNPDDPGTRVVAKLPEDLNRKVAACIVGQRHYKAIKIEKFGLNRMHGIGEKVFGIFAKRGISCEHYISGIYNFAIFLKNMMFDLKRKEIINEIREAIHPEKIEINKDVALVAIIGEGMGTVKGIFAQIFNAIAAQDIKVHMINQGADNLNIILGFNDEDFENAIRALYQAMIVDQDKI
ncbi:MAG: aspartate kinase [Synergistaceae bacterium]|nr:aspartate kinase [Synergistaceae bacterium]MBR0204820.1 aspartate kinase [Synergistaceae bacterium]